MRKEVYLPILCVLFLVAGCTTASFKERIKRILGTSTQEIEEARVDALKRTYPRDYDTCYTKTKEILKTAGSYIYADDGTKQMLAIYVSSTDTTTVGIFFNRIAPDTTEIQVASPSSSTRDTLAAKLFSALDNSFKDVPKGENTNAQE